MNYKFQFEGLTQKQAADATAIAASILNVAQTKKHKADDISVVAGIQMSLQVMSVERHKDLCGLTKKALDIVVPNVQEVYRA